MRADLIDKVERDFDASLFFLRLSGVGGHDCVLVMTEDVNLIRRKERDESACWTPIHLLHPHHVYTTN